MGLVGSLFWADSRCGATENPTNRICSFYTKACTMRLVNVCHLCAQINASILANCSVHVIEIFAWISMVQDTSLSLLFYTDVDSAAIISFKLEKTPKPVRVSFFTSTPSNILTYDKLANNSIYNLSAEQKNAHSNQQYQAPSQSPRVCYKNSEDP